jgi:hypothetical protein
MSIDTSDTNKVCEDCGHPFEETDLTTEFYRVYSEHHCDSCLREYEKAFVEEYLEIEEKRKVLLTEYQ